MSSIQKELTEVFQMVFDQPELVLSDSTTAKDVNGWDSITHISLVVAIEEHFNVRLSTSEVMRLKNVGEMVALLHKKTGRHVAT